MSRRPALSVYQQRLAEARGAARTRLLRELQADGRRGAQALVEREQRRVARKAVERRAAKAAFDRRFLFERRLWAQGHTHIAGVDEVGRGPLAGPAVVAAVILPPDANLPGLNDSKQLSEAQRLALVAPIRRQALAWSVVTVPVDLIDTVNIAQAVFRGMRRALAALAPMPDMVLVDGFRIPDLSTAQQAIVGGDGLSNSIAAASVLAKVHRDRLMAIWDGQLPGYGFARHKGYATAEHRAAIRALGPSRIHRRSFRWLGEETVQVELDLGSEAAAARDRQPSGKGGTATRIPSPRERRARPKSRDLP